MAAYGTPAVAAKLAEHGLIPAARGGQAMRARIAADRARNAELMRIAGIQPE